MFDKEAINQLQEGATTAMAHHAINDSMGRSAVVALPDSFTLHDLESYLPNRRRARGAMTTSHIQSFSEYTSKYAEPGTSVFVDQVDMAATAVLNLGTDATPGHADNTAVLRPLATAAYKALRGMATGAGKSQKDIAEFLEDWADCVTCFSESETVSTPRAIAAVRKLTIDSLRRLESEEKQLGAVKSAFESVQASSKETLPTTIYFTCIPYAEMCIRQFVLRLGVLTGDALPKVNLRIVKMEEHAEEMAVELTGLIEAQMPQEIPVLLGDYTSKS